MDTEKHLLLQKKISEGKSPNDEGPYYHAAFWESYKGAVKGKLGGLAIGAGLGAVAGGVMLAPLALAGVGLSAVAVVAGFSAAGSLYGLHEFGSIGKTVGSNASNSQLLEERMKVFVDGRVAEVKKDLNEIKATLTGTPLDNSTLDNVINKAELSEDDYRQTHYADLQRNSGNRFGFLKIALIGLVVGAALGALLGGAGLAAPLLNHAVGHAVVGAIESLGVAASATALNTTALTLLSSASFGLLGASYGVNRDYFRRTFDRTDSLFKGVVVDDGKVKEKQIEAGKGVLEALGVPEEQVSTYYRDKITQAADQKTQLTIH